ncbi:hypothetical protein E2562_001381 [Oryza meyeriana var. granulata]|uniref:Uncharacterized protein n=1 Tax=Oryza meyeriana var. granulata TaxID=110450 RepID=A0A6G1DCG4_9ORYZ|nr:hypothetical protein E2562_001381 [Oryza meyeriana var. granulata]
MAAGVEDAEIRAAKRFKLSSRFADPEWTEDEYKSWIVSIYNDQCRQYDPKQQRFSSYRTFLGHAATPEFYSNISTKRRQLALQEGRLLDESLVKY